MLQSRHTSPTTSKYRFAYGSSSPAWSGSANPLSVARNVALGSVPLMICCQAASLAAGSGIAAQQVAARRWPASVASRRQFGLDLGRAGDALADQALQQPPAQLGVHHQAVQLCRPVQQAGQHSQVAGLGGHAGERLQVGQLAVGTRLGPLASG